MSDAQTQPQTEVQGDESQSNSQIEPQIEPQTDPQFQWLLNMPAAYLPTPADVEEEPDSVPGIIKEVRDDSPISGEQHVRIVLKTDAGLVDVAHDRVEVIN